MSKVFQMEIANFHETYILHSTQIIYIYIYTHTHTHKKKKKKKVSIISFEIHLSIRDVCLVQTNLCSTIFSVGYDMKCLPNLISSF
jgi:hypothetical protein